MDGPFAMVPLRALADNRLKRSHLAVLGSVSYRARNAKNGSGCYAAHQTIAEDATCSRETVSRCLRDLKRWGYLNKVRQKDRKRYQYFIVGDAESVTHRSQTDALNVTHRSHSEQPECDPQITKSVIHTSHKERTKRYPAEAESLLRDRAEAERDSAEAATAKADRALEFPEPENVADMWSFRRQYSERLSRGHKPSENELDSLRRLFEQISEDGDEVTLSLERSFEDLLCKAESAAGVFHE